MKHREPKSTKSINSFDRKRYHNNKSLRLPERKKNLGAEFQAIENKYAVLLVKDEKWLTLLEQDLAFYRQRLPLLQKEAVAQKEVLELENQSLDKKLLAA